MAIVYQLNAKPRTEGERGLPKMRVASAYLSEKGMDGDFNRYRSEKKDGDRDMALLLMPLETLQQLNAEGWPVKPGDIGENITTQGIDYEAFAPGKRYLVGDARIEISEACTPCTNLAVLPYVGGARVKEFMKTLLGRRGWYARVLSPGMVYMHDEIKEAPE